MLQVEIRLGNLVEQSGLDAIVVPNDTELHFAGRVAGFLRTLGGESVLREATEPGPLRLGEVRLTGAGALQFKRIIHAAVSGYRIEDLTVPLRPGSLTSDAVLRDAVRHSLAFAIRRSVKSIGFSMLTAGLPGFPDEDAAHVMLTSLFDWVIEHPDASIERVVLCCFDDAELAACEAARTSLAPLEERVREAQEQAAAAERVRIERERAERERRESDQRDAAQRARAEADRRARREREPIESERVQRMFMETDMKRLPPDERTAEIPIPPREKPKRPPRTR